MEADVLRAPRLEDRPTAIGLIAGTAVGVFVGSRLQAHRYPTEIAIDNELAAQKDALEAQQAQTYSQLDDETRHPQSGPYAVSPAALRVQIAQQDKAIAEVATQRSHDGVAVHNLEFLGGGMASGVLLFAGTVHGVRYWRYRRRKRRMNTTFQGIIEVSGMTAPQ